MPVVDLVPPARRWECRDCAVKAEIPAAVSTTPMHACAGHKGFRLPLVPAGTGDRVFLVERGDYLNGEDVPLDAEGTPYMTAEVERADGHRDVFAYAPTARAELRV